MTEAIIAYVVVNVLDVVSTNYLLKRGGRELNPVMRWAMGKFGKAWVIPKMGLAGAALAIFLHFDLLYMVWAGAGAVVLVAANNFRLAKNQ